MDEKRTVDALQEEYEGYVAKWQERLGLQSWKITLKIVQEGDFDSPNTFACVDRDRQQEVATIKILHPDGYHWHLKPDYDPEFEIVHELVHLVFPFHPPIGEDEKEITLELAINKTGKALLELDRRGDETGDAEEEIESCICSECGRRWRLTHILRHLKPDDPTYYRCLECAENMVKDYRQAKEEETETAFDCDDCCGKFPISEVVSDGGIKRCKACYRKYGIDRDQKQARPDPISDKDKDYKCHLCAKIYVDRRNVHQLDTWKWMCIDCRPQLFRKSADKGFYDARTPEEAHFYSHRYQCHTCKLWAEGMHMETYFHHNNSTMEKDSHLNLCKACNTAEQNVETPVVEKKEPSKTLTCVGCNNEFPDHEVMEFEDAIRCSTCHNTYYERAMCDGCNEPHYKRELTHDGNISLCANCSEFAEDVNGSNEKKPVEGTGDDKPKMYLGFGTSPRQG